MNAANEADFRLYVARVAFAKALLELQFTVDRLLPLDAGDMSWLDLQRALPIDVAHLEAPLRHLERATLNARAAFDQLQARR